MFAAVSGQTTSSSSSVAAVLVSLCAYISKRKKEKKLKTLDMFNYITIGLVKLIQAHLNLKLTKGLILYCSEALVKSK